MTRAEERISGRKGRLDFRLESEARALLERAAAIEGRTLSEFVRHAAIEHARRAVAEYETLQLNDEARAEFLRALDNPPEPSARLRDAYTRYLEQHQSK